MAIDKESTGLPEVNIRRRTTKVNVSVVVAVLVFFAITAGVVWWLSASNP